MLKRKTHEEFISIFDDRLCKSTPLFDNMTYKDGKDIDRVIYLGDSKFVFHGKINDSEVLMLDVNKRAVHLTNMNIDSNKVNVSPDEIYSNFKKVYLDAI